MTTAVTTDPPAATIELTQAAEEYITIATRLKDVMAQVKRRWQVLGIVYWTVSCTVPGTDCILGGVKAELQAKWDVLAAKEPVMTEKAMVLIQCAAKAAIHRTLPVEIEFMVREAFEG